MQNLGGLSFMTYCNYDVNSLQINKVPVFCREVLKQWQSSKHTFRNDSFPHKEIIWNNRNIMVDGKPLFHKCWFENNITRVEDLLDNNSNFLSSNQFSEQYQLKSPFTLYFGLISSIPFQWKSEIANFNGNQKSSALLKKCLFTPYAESKILRYGFTQENIHRVYELPFKIKNDIKRKCFNTRLLNICPKCLADRHTMDQMFLHCSLTSSFWSFFQNLSVIKTKETVTLSNSIILYRVFENM